MFATDTGSQSLLAFEAATGATLWTTSIFVAGSLLSSPVVAGGVVYVASTGGLLFAVDVADGHIHWTATIPKTFDLTVPAIAGGAVYVSARQNDDTGVVEAFDATTGTPRWSANAGSGGISPPAVDQGAVYVAGADAFYAIDATTGASLWSTIGCSGPNPSAPAVANAVVYADCHGLTALDAATGATHWSSPIGVTDAPAVANGLVYVGGSDLRAVDAATGALAWSDNGYSGDPIVDSGYVYAWRDGGQIHAYASPVDGAALTISPSLPDFDTAMAGTVSEPLSMTITNVGTAPTTALGVTRTMSQFVVRSDTCADQELPPGASCTITASFGPTLPGPQNAALVVRATTGGSVQAVLHGLGNALQVQDTSKHGFGMVTIGDTATVIFAARNVSQGAITPVRAWIANDSPWFSITSDGCTGTTLASGQTCFVAVTFRPTAQGFALATLSVSGKPGSSCTPTSRATVRLFGSRGRARTSGRFPSAGTRTSRSR